MRIPLFLELLAATKEHGYTYFFGLQPRVTQKQFFEVAAVIFGRNPKMEPLHHSTVVGCVYQCFCRPEEEEGYPSLPTGWRRDMGLSDADARELFFAGHELNGHDPKIRSDMLRALHMFELPASARAKPVKIGAETHDVVEATYNTNGLFVPRFHERRGFP
jgi:hypothetical protein